MIIVMRPGATAAQVDGVREQVEASGGRSYPARDGTRTVLGCLGDADALTEHGVGALPGVESVTRWGTPYRLASRRLAPPGGRTVVRIGDGPGASVGGPALLVIAGPCSVEGREMLLETACGVGRAGATALRGGAFKPRTSPYTFQGLGLDALRWLAEVRRETGLPVVTEVLDPRQVELVAEHVDVLQVGARSMQNFPLLAEVGRVRRPVLLKRGMSATVTELLLAAEYVLARGNSDVILCERGIRTFEPTTRNTLDIAAIPVLRGESHLPVIVDPSHAGGRADLVAPLAYAAIAAGADGIMVEVHPRPATARSDGEQSLSLAGFAELMHGLVPFAAAAGRTLVPQPKALSEARALTGRLGGGGVLKDARWAEPGLQATDTGVAP
jgi:3-deoxy-7-phosphoheptulonate synthase